MERRTEVFYYEINKPSMSKKIEQMILKLEQPQRFKVTGGSYDRTSLKSCYYTTQAWFLNNTADYHRQIKKRLKKVKSTIYENLDRDVFKEDFIITNNIPEHGGLKGQQYITFEFTFFTTGKFNPSYITSRLDNITKQIEPHFDNDEYFNVDNKKHIV